MLNNRIKMIWVSVLLIISGYIAFIFLGDSIAQGQNLNQIFFAGFYERSGIICSDLYCMYPDGSGKKRITDFFPYSAREPEISYDGRHLAFSSNLNSFKSSNYDDIFRLDLTSSELRRVTGNEYVATKKTGTLYGKVTDDTGLELSNEEYFISYQGCDKVYTMQEAINLGQFKRVPAGKIWWKAVHSKHIGGLDYVEVPAGGVAGGDIKLTDGNYLVTLPAWSPDGTKIAGMSSFAYYDPGAYNDNGTIKEGRSTNVGFDTIGVWDINGTLLDLLETDFQETGGMNIQPKFSPDGTKLAYCRGPFPTQSIVVVPADNLNGTMIKVAEGRTDYYSYPIQTTGYTDPDWAPDGTRIACIRATYDTQLNLVGNVVLLDSSGSGEIIQITNVAHNAAASAVDFSPDGQWIAYALITSKSSLLNFLDLALLNFTSDIYIQNLSTGEKIQVTSDGASAQPCWSFAAAQPSIPSTIIDDGGSTTTVPGEAKCPFKSSINNQFYINLLRQIRMVLLKKDESLIEVFYENADEVTSILESEPMLMKNMQALVSANIDVAKILIDKGEATISKNSLKKLIEFLTALKEKANPHLAEVLGSFIDEIKDQSLLRRVGIHIVQ